LPITPQRAGGGKVDWRGGDVRYERVPLRREVKSAKTAVNYRNGSENERCGLCSMFLPPDGCTAVGGKISSQALCDLYEPRKKIA
jgi:hypothetical protein